MEPKSEGAQPEVAATPVEETIPTEDVTIEAPAETSVESQETPENPDDFGVKPRSRRALWWWLGSLFVLIVAAVAAWQFKWYQPLLDTYNAGTVTVRVREDDKFPVEGAVLALGGKTYATDENGKVTIDLVAGSYDISVTRDGFKELAGTLTVRRGENDLQSLSLMRLPDKLFAIKGFVVDYVSGLPLSDVSVTLGKATVKTDASGAYAFADQEVGEYSIKISKGGFAEKTLDVPVLDKDVVSASVPIVPQGSVIFTSNQTGKRGIYSVLYDGSGRQQLAPSSGEEYAPRVSADGKKVAFLSNRDGSKNAYGTIVPKLYVVDADGKNVKKVSDDFMDWSAAEWAPGGSYIYFSGYSDAQLSVRTLRFYDAAKGTIFDLDSRDQFHAFSADGSSALYSTPTTDQDGVSRFTLASVVFATGQRTVRLEGVAGSIHNVAYASDGKTVAYEVTNNNVTARYSLAAGSSTPVAEASDGIVTSREFFPAPGGQRKAFVEKRDGKTDLFTVTASSGDEKKLTSLGVVSASNAVTWDSTGTYISFGVSKSGEQAIYVVSTKGGDPKKVTDHFDDSGYSQ